MGLPHPPRPPRPPRPPHPTRPPLLQFRQLEAMIDYEQEEVDVARGGDAHFWLPVWRRSVVAHARIRQERRAKRQELLGCYGLCRFRFASANDPKDIWKTIAACLAPSRSSAQIALGAPPPFDEDQQSFG